MRPLLVLRPEPGATATARRAEAMGLRAIVAPLFTIEPVERALPEGEFDALMVTSANAVRTGLSAFRHLPIYAVGSATAEALREAGLSPVWIGEGDADDLIAALDRDGRRSALHPAGEEYREPAGGAVRITHLPFYRSVAVEELPAIAISAIVEGAVALLHSPRAAGLFASLTDVRASLAIAAISTNAARAAGEGWRAVAIAAQPSDQALLAAAARLCEE